MSPTELRLALADSAKVSADGFHLAHELCCLASAHEREELVQELVLRALEQREYFGEAQPVLDALVRELGLFPYLDPKTLPPADCIAREVHRPEALDVIFHGPQAAVYWAILRGESVVLSAPTSFGKSLIIDALIASGRFRNLLIVVPTIALIDETRRRLSQRFRDRFKVITHSGQTEGERNIFVATQERVLEGGLPERLDFFVIDEFYKLSPVGVVDDRCALLNQVLYRLLKKVKHFYMLGPNVQGLTAAVASHLEYRTFIVSYKTVVSELHQVTGSGTDIERLVALCRKLTEPTIIFCSSPEKAATIALAMIEAQLGSATALCSQAADWVAENYHREWHVTKSLLRGIGVHHARIPRALGQFVIRAFNDGEMQFLICTSTLIEGVNTKAKNIVVYDRTINRSGIDLFTFNNIRGRAGRMGQHFIGHVYIFHPPPEEDLPFVDMPVFSQTDATPESLLLQIDDVDLSDRSRGRLEKFFSEDVIDNQTLRNNNGIDPSQQLNLAREITRNPRAFQATLRWQGFPTAPQLQGTIDLLWKHFDGAKLARRSIVSAKQLAFFINNLRSSPSARKLIDLNQRDNADDAVRQVLDFLRLWAEFHFPRLLRALDRIQRDVFARAGLPAGDYAFFASQVEHRFLDVEIAALDEYGIPVEVARKLAGALRSDGDFDQALAKLRVLNIEATSLSPFEKALVLDAQAHC
jgi:hypothetical protein